MPRQVKITTSEEDIYKADFKKFDANGNGALDGDEMREMAKFQLGGSAPDEKIDELIQEMDKNSDGKIELCEYMDKILGPGWVVSDTDAEGEPIKCGRSYIEMKDLQVTMEKVYDEMKKIPLVCAQDEEKAGAASTAVNYLSGMTVLDTKMLVGLAMNMGKPAAFDKIKSAAEGAMKAGNGNTLVFHGGDGAADIVGIAKETGADAEATLTALWTATKDKPSDPKTVFPALSGVELGDCKPDFRVAAFTQFLEEDVEMFFQWGQIPLEQCHLVVIKKD